MGCELWARTYCSAELPHDCEELPRPSQPMARTGHPATGRRQQDFESVARKS